MEKQKDPTNRIVIVRDVHVIACIVFASAQIARADDPRGRNIQTRRVTYLPISGTLTTNAGDTRSEYAGFQVKLQGSNTAGPTYHAGSPINAMQ